MSSVYNIAVRMTMDAHGFGILRTIAHDFLHIGHHVNSATANLNRFRLALVGAGTAFAGFGIASGLAKMVDHGAQLVAIQNKMIAQGWQYFEVQEATTKAWELTNRYKSMSVETGLEMIKELSPVLGDRHEAVHIMDEMAKFYVSMQGALGTDKASTFSKQIRDAIRAGELSGSVLDPKIFHEYIDGMAKTLKAFGGTLTPTDYFMATKYGRASAINWTPEFTNQILPTIMQELGASSTGTAMMTLYSAIIGGRMSKRSINAFADLGMFDLEKFDPENLTPEGRPKRMQPGGMKGSRTMMENPYQWVWEYLIPAMKEKGILSDAHIEALQSGQIKGKGTIGEEARKIFTERAAILFGDRTAQGLIDMLALQYKKIERDRKLVSGAMGLDEGTKFFNEKEYKLAVEGFKVQWENLMQALGGPGVETATRTLQGVNEALGGMGQWAQANPETVKIGLVALGSLATALVTVGTAAVALAVLGGGGVIATILGAIGIFLGAMAALNWSNLSQVLGFTTSKAAGGSFRGAQEEGMNPIQNVIDQIGEQFRNAIASIPGMVAGAIMEMAASIGAKIAGALASIGSYIGGKLGIGGGAPAQGGTMDGFVQPQSFVPEGTGGKAIQINSQVNLDGHRVGTAVTRHVIARNEMVYGGAQFGARRQWTTPDTYSI